MKDPRIGNWVFVRTAELILKRIINTNIFSIMFVVEFDHAFARD